MSQLISRLESIAAEKPDAIAVSDFQRSMSWSAMMLAVAELADRLTAYKGQVLALKADNQIEWLLMDLACLKAGVVLLPIPLFFSPSQEQHAIEQSSAVAMVTTEKPIGNDTVALIDGLYLSPVSVTTPASLPEGTIKITFTSGSTGQPKGVCLSEANQLRVSEALLARTGIHHGRHLCVLPLATLLENIAGIYAPLLSRGEVVLVPMSALGFNGSTGLDISLFTETIDRVRPNSLILLPALLSGMLVAIRQGWNAPNSLKFIAVGGSRVGSGLLEWAAESGLPVFEGYGLSECSSVVSLNAARANQAGTAGKALPHIHVTIEDDEIVVTGNAFLGYVSDPLSWYRNSVRTGDLGFIDPEGYVHIMGRRKNLLISSYGRNINPEWLESEVLANPAITQCVVLGEARPYCVALIFSQSDCSEQAIDAWLNTVNSALPDYARIQRWLRLSKPLDLVSGTLTANGKPVREAIQNTYQTDIEYLYKEHA